jgi:hypothetical protein
MRFCTAALALALSATVIGDPSAATITVRAGEDLQHALNAARAGDTILLERGATFVGNFVIPERTGSDERVITLRTVGDTGLPAPGQRITPEAAQPLAKLRSPNNLPALRTAPGARGWHVVLLEFLGNRNGAGDIIALGDGSSAQNSLERIPRGFTLDRLYVHGDPEQGQKRAVALNSAETAIIGCHISDIKTIGQDSQAIAGWNGPGPYVIDNNYLEAAGENILFGGADPSILNLTPTKIAIRGNRINKPLAWREPGAPRWQVKNLLELKHARDVLIEGNLFERSWAHAQAGHAILFTVRNQDGGCGWCQVEDVRFVRNVVREMAAGIQVLGSDDTHPSRQTTRIVIAHNLFDGLDRRTWGGDGYFLQLSANPRDLVVDHNTIIQRASAGIVSIAGGRTDGFVFTNNVTGHGLYGIIGADRGVGNDSIGAYLPGAVISGNVIAGANRRAYPPDNQFPTVEEFQREFVGFAAGDYRLRAESRWRAAGTDGRDLGANISQLPFNLGPSRPGTVGGGTRAVPRR